MEIENFCFFVKKKNFLFFLWCLALYGLEISLTQGANSSFLGKTDMLLSTLS